MYGRYLSKGHVRLVFVPHFMHANLVSESFDLFDCTWLSWVECKLCAYVI
jgi:hypothetical protein